MSVLLVWVTTGDVAEAQRIGRAVVTERLAACANVIPGVSSIYWWQGAVQESAEAVLILKTTDARVAALIARVKTLHSYDCPGIEALVVADGHPAFLDWVARETGAGVE
jgi:periplasmic divalent cation tolerance protein